jgi:uncharacterized protein (TIGR02117 family)
MKRLKKLLKWIGYVLLIPVTYLLVSLLLTVIPVSREMENQPLNKTIFLTTNGVHLDIVIPKESIKESLLLGIKHQTSDNYLAFGWGDENFYINTPTWGDLTFQNAFSALFLNSSTLMHVTRYRTKRSRWVEIKISEEELEKLNTYIFNTFQTRENGAKIILENQGYSASDDFYKAKGSYSCFKTCNSWVNTGFKESGLKACLWTPFDFGLMNKYQE